MALPTHSLLQAACGLELSVLRINKGNRNARGNGQQEDKLGQREQVEKLEGLMLLLFTCVDRPSLRVCIDVHIEI